MKFEYDKEVDAAYIYIEKLLGIEILDASKVMNRKALMESQIA